MGIIVEKFGGSSISNTEKLFNCCKHIIKEYDAGNKFVVIVSAQGKLTDRLISEEKEITLHPSPREHDVLLSVGEQISIAKLVMCLENLGYNAISFCGWQIPIITDNKHGDCNIKKIKTDKIIEALNQNKIVVIAGFQGITTNGEITTLGRGGSDTTAVAISASLNAEICYIYTDVDGVYDKDPRMYKNSLKFKELTYDKMLELSNNGAKVLHNKCFEIAKEYKVPLVVKSTFKEVTGTLIN